MKIETDVVVTKVYKNELGELINRAVTKTSRIEKDKEIVTCETTLLYNKNDKLINETASSSTEITYVDTDSFQQDKAQMYNEFDEDIVQQAKTKLNQEFGK